MYNEHVPHCWGFTCTVCLRTFVCITECVYVCVSVIVYVYMCVFVCVCVFVSKTTCWLIVVTIEVTTISHQEAEAKECCWAVTSYSWKKEMNGYDVGGKRKTK